MNEKKKIGFNILENSDLDKIERIGTGNDMLDEKTKKRILRKTRVKYNNAVADEHTESTVESAVEIYNRRKITDILSLAGSVAAVFVILLGSVFIADNMTKREAFPDNDIVLPSENTPVPQYSKDKVTEKKNNNSKEENITANYGLFTYEIDDGSVTITGLKTLFDGAIEIPTEIEGYPVTKIKENAFSDQNITSVVISENVTHIGSMAFSNCRGLESVTLPDNLESIEIHAFNNCTNISTVNFSENFTTFDAGCFYCSKWLLNKQKENPLVIINNILVDGSACEGDVVIPDGVTRIAPYAFSKAKFLTSVYIPEGVETIGGYAFYECSFLKKITLPASLKQIEEMAFYDCDRIEKAEYKGTREQWRKTDCGDLKVSESLNCTDDNNDKGQKEHDSDFHTTSDDIIRTTFFYGIPVIVIVVVVIIKKRKKTDKNRRNSHEK